MGARSYSREGRILKLLTLTTVIVLCQGQNVTVVLDVYTPTSTLDNNTTLQLGTTCILICRTGGLPHGTDYNYTWTCPNGPCTIGQGTNTNRDTYGDRLLLNILSYSDAGTYTCQVRLATTGQLLRMDRFVLGVEGGIVLHSGNNLIPNNDFITSVQHITSSTTITIQCTSHQQPHWRGPNGLTLSTIQNNTLHQIFNGNTSILTIDTNNLNNFTNGRFSCNTTQHTANVNLYIGPGGNLTKPRISGSAIGNEFRISTNLGTVRQAERFIISYEHQDFNVPLDVEYQEAVVTGENMWIIKDIYSPGVSYLIKIWAVQGSLYSKEPGSLSGHLLLAQASSEPRFTTITKRLTHVLELNWIPPKQPNGPIQYQLNYGTNTTQFTTVDTAGDDTYYNLTGLQQNTTYYIRVVAVSYMTLRSEASTEGEWIAVSTLGLPRIVIPTNVTTISTTPSEDSTAVVVGSLVCGFLLMVGLAAFAAVLALAVKYYKMRALGNVYSVPDCTLEDHYEDMSKYKCERLEEGIYDTVDDESITDGIQQERVYQELVLEGLQSGPYAHIYNTPRNSTTQEEPSPSPQAEFKPPPRISRYIQRESPTRNSSGQLVETPTRNSSGQLVEPPTRNSSGQRAESPTRNSSGQRAESPTRNSSGQLETPNRNSSGQRAESPTRNSSGQLVETPTRNSSSPTGEPPTGNSSGHFGKPLTGNSSSPVEEPLTRKTSYIPEEPLTGNGSGRPEEPPTKNCGSPPGMSQLRKEGDSPSSTLNHDIHHHSVLTE